MPESGSPRYNVPYQIASMSRFRFPKMAAATSSLLCPPIQWHSQTLIALYLFLSLLSSSSVCSFPLSPFLSLSAEWSRPALSPAFPSIWTVKWLLSPGSSLVPFYLDCEVTSLPWEQLGVLLSGLWSDFSPLGAAWCPSIWTVKWLLSPGSSLVSFYLDCEVTSLPWEQLGVLLSGLWSDFSPLGAAWCPSIWTVKWLLSPGSSLVPFYLDCEVTSLPWEQLGVLLSGLWSDFSPLGAAWCPSVWTVKWLLSPGSSLVPFYLDCEVTSLPWEQLGVLLVYSISYPLETICLYEFLCPTGA